MRRFIPSRVWSLIFGLYLLVAIAITWPLVTDISGQLIGHHTGDAYEMGHHIWWFTHALKTGQPLFYQPLMAYPDGVQGISLWSNPLQFFPAWAFALVMPVAAAYNLTILLTMALNGAAMAYLVNRIARREGWDGAGATFYAPALLAGLAFEAFPVFQGHLFGGHAGLLVMWPVAFYVDALYRLNDSPTRGNILRTAVWFLVSPWGHTVQAICVLLPVTGLFVLAQAWRKAWGAAWRTCLAAGLGALMLAAFVFPVVADTFADDTYTGDQGYVMFSADLLGLVSPSFMHPVLGQMDYTHRVLGVNLIEGFTYYGVVAAALTVLALWKRRGARWWAILAGMSAILALGPLVKIFDQPIVLRLDNFESYVALPWAFIYDLPGFSLARAPGRFNFTVALAAAVLVGYGASVLWRFKWRTPVMLILAAVIVFEYQAAWPFPSVPANIPRPIAALKDDVTVRAVFHVPSGNLLAAKEAIYLQTSYQKPMIAGQVTRRTPVSPAKLGLLEGTLDPALLKQAGVDVVIAHKQFMDSGLTLRLQQRLGSPVWEGGRFAVYRVPETVEPAGFIALPASDVPDGTARTPTQADSYFYAPAPITILFSGGVSADGRDLTLTLIPVTGDPGLIGAWPLDGHRDLTERISVPAAGFYTLRLTVGAPCPSLTPSPTLACRALITESLKITPDSP